MKFLLLETITASNLNVDIRIPYISGLLRGDKHQLLHIRTTDLNLVISEMERFNPDYIIADEKTINHLNGSKNYIPSGNFQEFYSAFSKRQTNIFVATPVFECDIERLNFPVEYIPHLVLSNPCNYTRSIMRNPLYRGLNIPRWVKRNGCTFCRDIHSNQKWGTEDRKDLKRQISSAIAYLRRHKGNSFRIIGERHISRLEYIIEVLTDLGVKHIEIIITLRPELLIEEYRHFIKGITLAEKGDIRIVICSIGIESFYSNDLLLYNRFLNAEGLLKSISLLYDLKRRFKETLITDRYNLFNFILFNPYTSPESIEYNLRVMKFTGMESIPQDLFLNKLIIDKYTPVYYKIKKDGLLSRDSEWRFMDRRIDHFYKRVRRLKQGSLEIDTLYRELGEV